MNKARKAPDLEIVLSLSIVALLQLVYLLGRSTYPNSQFGFNQLKNIPPIVTLLLFATFWSIGFFSRYISPKNKYYLSIRKFYNRWWGLFSILLAGFAYEIFYLFQNNFINADGLALLQKIPQDVPSIGTHITHDEMLELFLHSRFWFYTNQLFGWSVKYSYHVLSSFAGALYIFILLILVRLLKLQSKLNFIGLMLSGGYIQLFFGDVENYTLVSMLIFLYLCLGYLYIESRIPLWVIGLTLSISLGFHLLAGWLIPSFIYLIILAWKREDRKGIFFGLLGVIAPFVFLLTYFDRNGLPIDNLLYRSHALGALLYVKRYICPFQGSDFISFLNLLLLLLPAIVFLPILVVFHRIRSDPFTRFLVFAASFMFGFVILWKLQLGIYEDWNLVAPAMIPLSTLIAFSYAHMPEKSHKNLFLIAFILTSILHTSMWILSNNLPFQ